MCRTCAAKGRVCQSEEDVSGEACQDEIGEHEPSYAFTNFTNTAVSSVAMTIHN